MGQIRPMESSTKWFSQETQYCRKNKKVMEQNRRVIISDSYNIFIASVNNYAFFNQIFNTNSLNIYFLLYYYEKSFKILLK